MFFHARPKTGAFHRSESCFETDRVPKNVVACLAIRPQLQKQQRYAADMRAHFPRRVLHARYTHTHARIHILDILAYIESHVRVHAKPPTSNFTFNLRRLGSFVARLYEGMLVYL